MTKANVDYSNLDEKGFPQIEPNYSDDLSPILSGQYSENEDGSKNISGKIESVVRIQNLDNELEYGLLYSNYNGEDKILNTTDLNNKIIELIENDQVDQIKGGAEFSINYDNHGIKSFVVDDNYIVQDKVMQEFLENYSSNQKLNEAVIAQMGGFESFAESAPDIANHGIDGGAHGFTYNEDTVSFAQDNRSVILEALQEDAQEFGHESVPEMMTHWKSLEGYSQDEIAEALYSNDENHEAHTSVYNALAWYAGEKASHEYVNAMDEIKAELTPLRPSDANLDLTDRIEDFANKNGYLAKVTTDEEHISIEIKSKTDRVDVFLDNDSVMVYSDDKYGERSVEPDSTNIDNEIINAINDGLGFNNDNFYSISYQIDGKEYSDSEKSLSLALDTFSHYPSSNMTGEIEISGAEGEDKTIYFERKDEVNTYSFDQGKFSNDEVAFIQNYAEEKQVEINKDLDLGKVAEKESKGMELD